MNDMVRGSGAQVWTERALRLAEDAGDPRQIANTLNDCAVGFFVRGLPRVGAAVLNLAAAYSREQRLGMELGRTLTNVVALELNRGLDAALLAGSEAMSVTEQTGNTQMCWHTAANQAIALTIAGRWDEVSALRDRPLLRERPPERLQAAIFACELGFIALARDDEVDLAELDALASIGESGEPVVGGFYFAAVRGVHARAGGDTAALVQACRRTVELAHTFIGLEDDFPHLWAAAVGWTVEARDFTAARDLLRLVNDIPAPRLSPLVAGQLARLRGTIEAADRSSTAEPSRVESDLVHGIAALDEFGAIPDRARAQATLGRWLARQGRAVDADPYLKAARETFIDLRASAWLRELESAPPLHAVG